MKLFWLTVYNFIILPILFTFVLLLYPFRSKIRRALNERRGMVNQVRIFFAHVDRARLVYWFHCASHGEYEQVRPVLRGLKEVESDCTVVVSFFSPSGFTNVNDDYIDQKIYLPFDFPWSVSKMLKLVRPHKLIFAEYDVWPNLVWSAERLKIHTTLFSARLHGKSSKLWPVINNFYSHVYSSLTSVYTISEKDHIQLRRLLLKKNRNIVRVLGSPRYDRVKDLAEESVSDLSKSILERPLRFVAGSVWPEDDQLILDSILEIVRAKPEFGFTWVPHEPNDKYISKTFELFSKADLAPKLYSQIGNGGQSVRVIIMDQVGYLSQLYWQGRFAYVGGGFTTGIHNVMEPAMARLPTIFGPKYHNSHAAEELLENGGGFTVNTKNEFRDTVNRLLDDELFFLNSSTAATNVIHKNIGSATRVVRGILRD